MSFAEFQRSVAGDANPPPLASLAVQALWYDARGDWERAHTAAQEDSSRSGAWVHAYLHRKTGDLGNAGYWYARAAQPLPAAEVPAAEVPAAVEWAEIVRRLLA